MALTIPTVSPHIDAIISALSATTIPIGDGEAPQNTEPPYAILYLVSGLPPEGPLDDWQADLTLQFQLTCVGVTSEQARLVADLCSAVMVKENISIPGRRVMFIQQDGYTRDMREERSIPNPIFSTVVQYIVKTTPT